MFMLKVHILDRCPECLGEAYLPNGQAASSAGEVYTRYAACPACEGSGVKSRWVDLREFARLLVQDGCRETDEAQFPVKQNRSSPV